MVNFLWMCGIITFLFFFILLALLLCSEHLLLFKKKKNAEKKSPVTWNLKSYTPSFSKLIYYEPSVILKVQLEQWMSQQSLLSWNLESSRGEVRQNNNCAVMQKPSKELLLTSLVEKPPDTYRFAENISTHFVWGS